MAQRYKAAVAKITEANEMVPNLTDVKHALNQAQEKVRNPPPQPFPWALMTLGVTLISVGAYGGMWGKRWWKNRFRVTPTQVIGFIERGLNPNPIKEFHRDGSLMAKFFFVQDPDGYKIEVLQEHGRYR